MCLSGCNLGTGDPTNSGFATPLATGALSKASRGRSGADTSTLTGNTYGFQVGAVSNDGLQGFAGIAPGASVTAPPVSGSATFDGRFEVGLIAGIYTFDDQVSGRTSADNGAISLTADFAQGTLTGGGTGLDMGSFNTDLSGNVLTVDGTFSGSKLSGTVTYDGVKGPLTGLVGGNEVIGAFHAHNDRHVHAGGFIAN